MNKRHVHRKLERTPEELADVLAARERYQRERPTPEQLLADSGHPAFVPLGELMQLHELAATIRQERLRLRLTLAQLAERTGIDQAALSRLEGGKNPNPTLDTLFRVAKALGKEVRVTLRDLAEPASA